MSIRFRIVFFAIVVLFNDDCAFFMCVYNRMLFACYDLVLLTIDFGSGKISFIIITAVMLTTFTSLTFRFWLWSSVQITCQLESNVIRTSYMLLFFHVSIFFSRLYQDAVAFGYLTSNGGPCRNYMNFIWQGQFCLERSIVNKGPHAGFL